MRFTRVSGSDSTVPASRSAIRCSSVLMRSSSAAGSLADPDVVVADGGAPGTSRGSSATVRVCGWLATVTSCDDRSYPAASTSRTYWPGGTCANVNVPFAADVVVRSGAMPGMLAGMAGAPGGGSTRSVTSAPAMTPPRAFDTLPPTVAVWADAPAAVSRTAAQAAARQNLRISTHLFAGTVELGLEMTARIVERGQPT